ASATRSGCGNTCGSRRAAEAARLRDVQNGGRPQSLRVHGDRGGRGGAVTEIAVVVVSPTLHGTPRGQRTRLEGPVGGDRRRSVEEPGDIDRYRGTDGILRPAGIAVPGDVAVADLAPVVPAPALRAAAGRNA